MIQHLSESLKETVSVVSERKAQGGVKYIGIPTGFRELDAATGGLRNSDLYIVAGRTGMGKSAFGLSLMLEGAKRGHTALYVSLEMSTEVLATRLLSGLSMIPSMDIEYGRMNDEQYAKLITSQQELMNLPLWVWDDVVTSDQVLEEAKKLPNLEAIYIDHASLLSDAYGSAEWDRVSHIVHNLKHIAVDLNIPVVALAQLNRNVESREPPVPILSDLRDTGSFEQDASVVIFLYRPAYYHAMSGDRLDVHVETDAQIRIAKNRHGPTGGTNAKFYPKRMFWEQV